MVELTPRLAAVAGMVEKGSVIADIGTDHAYIPAYLIEKGVIERAFACDIKIGPLQNAEKTMREHGIGSVDFILCDGLSGVSPESIDTVVIAGMGGEMIAAILEQAPWCRDARYRFVFQPMTKAEVLREYLYRTGFEIQRETLAAEKDKLYTVMLVCYTGVSRNISEVLALLGEARADPLFEEKRRREIKRLKAIYRSLENKKDAAEMREKIAALIKEIEVYSC